MKMYIFVTYTFFCVFQLTYTYSFYKSLINKLLHHISTINMCDLNEEHEQTQTQTRQQDLKHLVISGGAHGGFIYYGIIKELVKQNVLSMEEIETFYGTSIGSYFIVILLLQYDWDTIDEYLIKRPWQHVFKFDLEHIIRSLQTGGVFNKEPIYALFDPLFKGKDMSVHITLQEFYEKTQKEIHFFVTDFTNLDTIDISYKTHPNWKLIDTVYASGSLPIIFEPHCDPETQTLFLDGAVLLNYPLSPCLSDTNAYDQILGIYNNDTYLHSLPSNPLQGNSLYKLLEYIFMIIIKLWLRIKYKRTEYEQSVPHQIAVDIPMGIHEMVNTLNSAEERERLIRVGESYAHAYMRKWDLTIDSTNDSDTTDIRIDAS